MSEVTPIIRPDGSVVIPIYNEQSGSATPIEDVSPEKVAYISQADKDKLDSISVSSLVYIETLESTASELLIQIDSKQPSGDYANTVHTHTISAVDNLQTTLDSKQPSGNYVDLQTLESTASQLIVQIDSKQPSGNYSVVGHTHSISSVDNLQTTLDSKQPSGSYASSIHTHAISSVTNLQTTLDSKQPSGNYANSVHTHSISSVDNLQTNLDNKLDELSPIYYFSGSVSSSQIANSGDIICYSASGSMNLETYTQRFEGFQFIVSAKGGAVTFSGVFGREGTGSILSQGKMAYVVRMNDTWQVGATLI